MNSVESVTNGDLHWVKSNHSTSDMLSWNADYKDSISSGIQDMNFQSVSGSLYERETDRLLDGLGPRFIDWWMHKPLPVDADLLPELVPGFKPPFRLCPPYDSAKLADSELTYVRKLAHPLPTHFVLGTFLLLVICQFLFWLRIRNYFLVFRWMSMNWCKSLRCNSHKILTIINEPKKIYSLLYLLWLVFETFGHYFIYLLLLLSRDILKCPYLF